MPYSSDRWYDGSERNDHRDPRARASCYFAQRAQVEARTIVILLLSPRKTCILYSDTA
jgi:hypothetical protein